MLIDYTNGRERHELLCSLQGAILGDYILKKVRPEFDPDMSPGEQASEYGKIMRYLRDNLIIEWKGGTGYTPEPDDEDGYEYNRVEEDNEWMVTTTLDDHPNPWMEE